MKHTVKTTLFVLITITLIPVLAVAANGKTARENAVPKGEPFSVTGTVVSFENCSGLVLATDSGEITLYGLGPERYWEEMGIDFPSVGESVDATGYVRSFNETQRYIVFSLTIDGTEIDLRDTDTGRPLWRKAFGIKKMHQPKE